MFCPSLVSCPFHCSSPLWVPENCHSNILMSPAPTLRFQGEGTLKRTGEPHMTSRREHLGGRNQAHSGNRTQKVEP
jgi:hypothetical protein